MDTPTTALGPTSPPAGDRQWPLTPIDRYALQWLIQGTWVFDTRLDPAALKRGLARLLDEYPILCGRVSGGTRIEHSAAGVPFTVASDPTCGVADFDRTTTDVRRFADRHSTASIRLGRAPLLTVKLTEIRDGCVLAVCCSHACVDGNGFYSMVRNLGRAASGRDFPAPVFERPPAAPPRPRADVKRSARAAGWHGLSPIGALRGLLAMPRMHDRAFVAHFTPAALAEHRQSLADSSGVEALGTNSALLARVAGCIATLVGLDEAYAVSAAVDQRGRVSWLPDTFAGNAVSIAVTPKIPVGASPAAVAALIHAAFEPRLRRPSPVLEADAALTAEVAAHALPLSPFPAGDMFRRRPTLLYTNSFRKLPVYDVDFGDDARELRPVRAIPHNLGDPILLWPAPPPLGGIDLYFSGRLARAVSRLDADHPWWDRLRGPDSA